MREIILIWWAPTTWKSTLTKKISKKLWFPYISTDTIRNILKIYADKEKEKWLFLPKGYETATKFLNHFSPQEISDMEFEEWKYVWPWIMEFINNNNAYRSWIIIEWVWITPELIKKNILWLKQCFPIFIFDNDDNRTKNVIYNRWLFEAAKNYSDSLKEKEIEWVKIFTKRIKKECKEYNIKCIEIEKKDSDTDKIIKEIKNYFKA